MKKLLLENIVLSFGFGICCLLDVFEASTKLYAVIALIASISLVMNGIWNMLEIKKFARENKSND